MIAVLKDDGTFVEVVQVGLTTFDVRENSKSIGLKHVADTMLYLLRLQQELEPKKNTEYERLHNQLMEPKYCLCGNASVNQRVGGPCCECEIEENAHES